MTRVPGVIVLDGGVRLERWSEDHLGGLLDAIEASLPELQAWMPWATPVPTRQQEAAVVARAREQFDRDEDYQWVVVDGDVVAGGLGLHPMAEDVYGIGYWLRTDRVGRGIVTRAVAAVGEIAFSMLGASALEIHCDRANVRSAGVPRRLGYTLVGEVGREILTAGHTGVGYVFRLDAETDGRGRP